eukprot:TRINITY_DN14313_c0_g1_i1.p1 TRINITY_DN14313_c0_g1~~TRINITY_DN14313_c0_g1_i1.p1  ORF type:complete len:335 (-),score=94.19 TRINITY_DN14313_c0_g1_i1:62-1066(-)
METTLDDLKFNMQTRRRIQGIFQVNDTVVFLLNLALQLANSQENLEDIDSLSVKYELSVENAVKLSLAARLLKDEIPENMLDRPVTSTPPSEAGGDGIASNTLYVRNIPTTTPEHEIVSVFQNFGTIKEVRVQRDKQTGQFYGSVFVEYVNSSAARLAYIQVNQKLWGSNTVHVDFAKERNAGASTGSKAPETDDKPVSPSIFIANLPHDIDRGTLYSLFARFGAILDVRILTDKATGQGKGVAFIDYSLQESAVAAKEEMNGSPFMAKTLKVSYASHPGKKEGATPSAAPTGAAPGATPVATFPPPMPYAYDPSLYAQYPPPAAYGGYPGFGQ